MKKLQPDAEAGERRVRVRALYTGHVQGVGFRYTVCDLAALWPVSGWVRNEPDESVRLEAEGTEAAVRGFLQAIRTSRLARYIDQEHLAWGEALGERPGFRIEHGW